MAEGAPNPEPHQTNSALEESSAPSEQQETKEGGNKRKKDLAARGREREEHERLRVEIGKNRKYVAPRGGQRLGGCSATPAEGRRKDENPLQHKHVTTKEGLRVLPTNIRGYTTLNPEKPPD